MKATRPAWASQLGVGDMRVKGLIDGGALRPTGEKEQRTGVGRRGELYEGDLAACKAALGA